MTTTVVMYTRRDGQLTDGYTIANVPSDKIAKTVYNSFGFKRESDKELIAYLCSAPKYNHFELSAAGKGTYVVTIIGPRPTMDNARLKELPSALLGVSRQENPTSPEIWYLESVDTATKDLFHRSRFWSLCQETPTGFCKRMKRLPSGRFLISNL